MVCVLMEVTVEKVLLNSVTVRPALAVQAVSTVRPNQLFVSTLDFVVHLAGSVKIIHACTMFRCFTFPLDLLGSFDLG